MIQMIAATDGSDAPIDLHALAASAGIAAEYVISYGRDVAEVDLRALESSQYVNGGGASSLHYIVVTAITPMSSGEGKATTAIRLAWGLSRLGQQATLALHRSATGPTFGVEGGAGGSDGARILSTERMSLYPTNDLHIIIVAHNFLSVMIGNHLRRGNELDIDRRITTRPRVLDVNDRALCHIVLGLRVKTDGVIRQAPFDIAPVSESVVIMSLATDLSDLHGRLGRIVIGRNRSGEWINAEDLRAAGVMCAVLRGALGPNPLRTGEGTPVLVHTGPFSNIATGCSSVTADRAVAAGVRDSGYILAEAGSGSDMGLERFVDLKYVVSGMYPSVAVVVVTTRTLRAHSERRHLVNGKDLSEGVFQENVNDVYDDAVNLLRHLQIAQGFGITSVVTVNVFLTDHDIEIGEVTRVVGDAGAWVAVCHSVTRGGEGCPDLAGTVVGVRREAGEPVSNRPVYEPQDDLRTKTSKLADLYGADGMDYTPVANKLPEAYEQGGFSHLPVIVAKIPPSLSAEPGRKGVSTGWCLSVREVRLTVKADYVYAIYGSLSTMSGLSSQPAVERADVGLDTGQIVGLR